MIKNLALDLSGHELLHNPIFNKGLAFTDAERAAFGLDGLLPQGQLTLNDQTQIARTLLDGFATSLEKHIFLRNIQDTNETLFYALITADLEGMLPLIYTPTVGEACQKFSAIWQRPRGLFLAWPNRHDMAACLADPRFDDVRVIVVTDGERILGLGDQGAGGMGIPIGKSSIYTACGVPPEKTLPILLDVGTDNPQRLHDPAYVGWRHERIRGAEYDAFIKQFVACVRQRWPHIIIHWEDFASVNAARLLNQFRNEVCSYNDDIQGTAAVTTGAILAATAASGQKLSDHVIVMLGAGSAGVGIGQQLLKALEGDGVDPASARRQIFMLDKDGLLTTDRAGELDVGQKLFARDDWGDQPTDFASLMGRIDATILIGVSGAAGVFTETIVRTMAQKCTRPIIFPLSNPASHSEATPQDLMFWTDGQALVSTGGPFPAISHAGKTRRVDQTNNAYIFPGMGLGIIATRASRATDAMYMAAAKKLADLSPLKDDPSGNLLPPVTQLREVAREIAFATALQARAEGVCPGFDDADLPDMIAQATWKPEYKFYKKVRSR